MMLKLEIKKYSFFYCGDIALSKKSKPTIELDIDKLEDKIWAWSDFYHILA